VKIELTKAQVQTILDALEEDEIDWRCSAVDRKIAQRHLDAIKLAGDALRKKQKASKK
jgi:hypothetical protein